MDDEMGRACSTKEAEEELGFCWESQKEGNH
jgi:hypothetical protein